MPFISGLYFLCFVVLIGLALFILQKNPKAWLNRYFALFAFSILGWLVTLYLFNRQADTPFLTLLGRANFAFAACIVVFDYLFLPQVAGRRARSTWPIAIETALLILLTLTTGLIDTSEHIRHGQHVTVFGPLFPFYILHLIGYLAAAFYVIFWANRQATARVRGQLAIIGLGIVVMAGIAVTTNLILPYAFHLFAWQEAGALSTIALLVAIVYAITTRALFDVRVIIRRTVIYTVLFGSIITVYSASILLVGAIALPGTVRLDSATVITNLVTMAIVGFAFEPLRRQLTRLTDHFLYKREYEQQEVLRNLTRKLNDVITLDEALEILMQTTVRVLHLSRAVTYIFQPGDSGTVALKRVKQIGYANSAALQKLDEKLIQYFSGHPEILLRDNLEATLAKETAMLQQPRQLPKEAGLVSTLTREHEIKQAVQQAFANLKATVAVPFHLGELPVGLLLLSEKGSGEAYAPGDLALLETIGGQAISSIQKARLYEGDQMKSEFVSIASHELLTPISAMQGYLSMILDEHIGTVDDKARGYLDKVYASAKRLSVLVRDLLSVSRIEADRMKFEPQALDLAKTISEAVDQLHFTATEKHLKLAFAKPAEALPPVWADPDRTMEVLINLIGNAIKYTPQGSITIRVFAEPKPAPRVTVEIADTGLGMSKQAQAHLFEKFYRVATPQTTGIAGTGLGLYITKSMVEKMGGSIAVHSEPGKGSTFSFNLPIFQVEKAHA